MKLYRYGSLNKYILKYIRDMDLYFQNPLNFNDPFECDLSSLALGVTNNFEEKYSQYCDLLSARLNYLLERMDHFRIRVHDYVSDGVPKSERYYFDDEYNSLLKESKRLKDELTILVDCPTSKREEALNTSWKQKREQAVKSLGVVCFSEISTNILMWSHYAEAHKGICFEYETTERPVKRWKSFKYYPVAYSDERYINVLETGYFDAFLKLVTTKSKDWEYEKEHRLVSIKGSGYQKSPLNTLKGVIFGLRIREKNKENLEEFMDALEFHNSRRKSIQLLKLYQAEKDANSFSIKIKRLPPHVNLREHFGL